MSIIRSLVRTALRRLDDGGQAGQGSAPLMLPPPSRSELGFPLLRGDSRVDRRSENAFSIPRSEAAPVAWQPPAPPAPRRRRKTVTTMTEEVIIVRRRN